VSTTARKQALALSDLRYSRRALRIERTRVAHWRRLLRARIDLTVATATLPEPLGQDHSGVLPTGAERDLPCHLDLVCAVLDERGPTELDYLVELRDLDRRLASYESTIGQALGGATEELIRQLTLDPPASLRVLHEIP